MCTSIILFRKSHKWPVIIGTNRDERLTRKSKFPARHWQKKYPNIIAGKDEEKKGSWIGINDHGLTAIIHNRKSNDKSVNNKNSRGLIVLNVLKNSSMKKALKYISSINQLNFNNFNLLVANYNECFWIKNDTKKENIIIKKLDEGLSIMTDKNLNDRKDKKINFYYKLFASLKAPNPTKNDWKDWKVNLTKIESAQSKNKEKICFINYQLNYGTKSSSLIGVPNANKIKNKIVFKATHSFPKKNNYIDVVI